LLKEKTSDYDQRVLNLYGDYAHGRIARRDFLQRAAAFAVGGITAEALLSKLAWQRTIGFFKENLGT